MSNVELAKYALMFGAVMIGVVFFFIMRESMRRSFKSKATDKKTKELMTRLQIIGKDDTEYMSWGVIDSLVIRDVNTGDEYPLENVRFVRSWFPQGMFQGLGLQVNKAIFKEGDKTPVLRKKDNAPPSNLTKISGMLRKERFVAVATGALAEFQKKLDEVKGKEINPWVMYGLAGFSILVGGAVLYVLVFVVMPFLERLSTAAGY